MQKTRSCIYWIPRTVTRRNCASPWGRERFLPSTDLHLLRPPVFRSFSRRRRPVMTSRIHAEGPRVHDSTTRKKSWEIYSSNTHSNKYIYEPQYWIGCEAICFAWHKVLQSFTKSNRVIQRSTGMSTRTYEHTMIQPDLPPT